LVTEAHICEQLSQGCYATLSHDLLITNPMPYNYATTEPESMLPCPADVGGFKRLPVHPCLTPVMPSCNCKIQRQGYLSLVVEKLIDEL